MTLCRGNKTTIGTLHERATYWHKNVRTSQNFTLNEYSDNDVIREFPIFTLDNSHETRIYRPLEIQVIILKPQKTKHGSLNDNNDSNNDVNL